MYLTQPFSSTLAFKQINNLCCGGESFCCRKVIALVIGRRDVLGTRLSNMLLADVGFDLVRMRRRRLSLRCTSLLPTALPKVTPKKKAFYLEEVSVDDIATSTRIRILNHTFTRNKGMNNISGTVVKTRVAPAIEGI